MRHVSVTDTIRMRPNPQFKVLDSVIPFVTIFVMDLFP